MATQRLTIAKIAGTASAATYNLFCNWQSQRTTKDENEWSSDQWPEHVRRSADEWALKLKQNSHMPPILFFAEYVDAWSYCPPARHIRDDALIQIAADRFELFCLPLPASAEVGGYLREVRETGQWHEDRLFGNFTIEAMDAWENVTNSAVIVFLREVLGGSVEDKQVEHSLTVMPEWFGGDLTSRST